jgi:Uma2 family endonuclease
MYDGALDGKVKRRSPMSMPLPGQAPRNIVYPESDGLPMADNSIQFRWIFVLYGNLAALFADAANVLVGGNQFWYPREGDEHEKNAPDVYVVFGRPKGDRGSYKQWEEDGIAMTVVFEVLSPSNSAREMAKKLAFYDEYGVEEYYVFDPDENELLVYLRGKGALRLSRNVRDFTSPRLGIRFDLTEEEMVVSYPDGRRFLTFEQLDAERKRERQQRLDAERAAEQARNDLARLRELSRKARRQQATPEELQELERLEEGKG